jgi:outer membrane immunogenic protein
MPVKAPPPPAPVVAVYDWTGFYIGANGGWGSSRNCWDFVDAFGNTTRDFCRRAEGGLAGGQIGYRWQGGGGWIWGLEAQGDWANLKSDTVSVLDPRFIAHSRIDAIGLFTGQVGWATNWANSSVLFYIKGGGAVIGNRFDFRDRAGNVLATTGDDTRWGGTVGAGFEWGFSPGWSFGVEYDHLFMGDTTRTFVSNGSNLALGGPAGFVFASDRIREDIDMVTVRVNYRFNWGGLGTAR